MLVSRPRLPTLIGVALAVAVGLPGCGPARTVTLNGAGSSFAKDFFEASIDGFERSDGDVTVNYGGGGSGKGRTDLQGGLVDFAGTDGLVKAADRPKYKGPTLYVPTVAAPITISYNVRGVHDLVLDADTVAKIFQRDITVWDDPAIAGLNPGVALPPKPIVVAHRSDGSGTTEQLTKYLVKAAPSWRLKSGSTVEWPADTQAGNGNAGVSAIVKAQDGAIGYVDLADANTQQLARAKLRNRSGRAIAPTLAGTTAALEAVPLKDDLTYDSLDSADPEAYPIASPTWVLVYGSQSDRARGQALKAFLTYMLGPGQERAPLNDYAPLPKAFVAKAQAAVDSIAVPA